jgi:hypothetical protein
MTPACPPNESRDVLTEQDQVNESSGVADSDTIGDTQVAYLGEWKIHF